jgi:hypothetical protein
LGGQQMDTIAASKFPTGETVPIARRETEAPRPSSIDKRHARLVHQ